MTDGITVKITAAPGLTLPSYQTPGSSGADVRASIDTVIPPRGWAAVPTGLFCEMPDGWEIQVRSRSGLALKEGIFVLNSPGTVDSDYRGEIKVILANLSDKEFVVKAGDRIAQLVLAKVERASFTRADRLSGTDRGDGGFGHTGT
ncbi:MAG TPA: dUTP diphosphatase [bacterium]|nr:dUTP diphosphatase [bacterium]